MHGLFRMENPLATPQCDRFFLRNRIPLLLLRGRISSCIDMSKLNDLVKENESHWTHEFGGGFNKWIVLLAITISFPWYMIKRDWNLSSEDIISLCLRFGAAISLYLQSDYYRRKLLVLLPETNVTRLSTLVSGIALAILILAVIHSNSSWLFLFGLMMMVVSIRNAIAWVLLRVRDREHPLINYFQRWTFGTFGYSASIFLIAPITYALRECRPHDIIIPAIPRIMQNWYIDFAPAVIFLVGMLLSISRLQKNISQIRKDCEQHYQKK